MSQENPRNESEDKIDAVLAVKYLSRLHALHARLYGRVQKLLTFISLAAGLLRSCPCGGNCRAALLALESLSLA